MQRPVKIADRTGINKLLQTKWRWYLVCEMSNMHQDLEWDPQGCGTVKWNSVIRCCCGWRGSREIRMLRQNISKFTTTTQPPPSLVNLIMSPRIVICIQILPPCHIFYHPLCHEMKPIYKSFSLWFVKWNWWTSESWMACLNNWAVLNQTTLGSGSGTAIWNNYHMTADYTWVLPPQGLHI